LRDVVERDLPQTGVRATPGELAAVFSAHRDVAAAAARTRYYLDHRNRTDG
jgi:hypothetical protein